MTLTASHLPPSSPQLDVSSLRVVLIMNILPPYRIPWVTAMSRSRGIRLETWLMARSERNRDWDVPSSSDLSVRVFRDWGLDLSHRDYIVLHFNPGMLRLLARQPPDIVLLGGYDSLTCLAAALLLRARGVPFLFGVESTGLSGTPTGRWTPWLVKKCLRSSLGVFVPGRASWVHVRSLGIRADHIFSVPNSVDVDRFSPVSSPEERRELRERLGLPGGLLCLYVGQLSERKGVDVLLEGFRMATKGRTDVHLILIGSGKMQEELQRQVAQEPDLVRSVHFLGYQSEDDLPRYYAACDLFVFPTRGDVWGMVLNEAMSAGLPVVTSDQAAGALDLVEEGVTGFTFASGDANALAGKLGLLLGDESQRRRMALAARDRILSGFTPERQARQLLDVVRLALARPNSGPPSRKDMPTVGT